MPPAGVASAGSADSSNSSMRQVIIEPAMYGGELRLVAEVRVDRARRQARFGDHVRDGRAGDAVAPQAAEGGGGDLVAACTPVGVGDPGHGKENTCSL